ncbi:hypothetical protein CP082626L3_0007A, partial [Chlamydia psittaci 08-2626_L3]
MLRARKIHFVFFIFFVFY